MRQCLLDITELLLSPAYSSHGCLDKICVRSSQSALTHGALALADGLHSWWFLVQGETILVSMWVSDKLTMLPAVTGPLPGAHPHWT